MKGGTYENEIARQLSLWFTDGKRDDVFGRSDGSGGRFTSRWKKGKGTANQGGDITFIDVIGEPLIKIWSIEVKTGYSGKKKVKDADGDVVKVPVYSKSKKGQEKVILKWKDKVSLAPWDALDLVDSQQKQPVFSKMWEQCARDAALTGCHPILIFRRNGRQSCICIKKSYYLSLVNCYGDIFGNSVIVRIDKIDADVLVIFSLKQFFFWAQPVCKFLSK